MRCSFTSRQGGTSSTVDVRIKYQLQLSEMLERKCEHSAIVKQARNWKKPHSHAPMTNVR